jgi:hypothetical protein
MLRDPNHNEFEIHVAKKSRELFLIYIQNLTKNMDN